MFFVITPVLASMCGWASYDAVTVVLASDVFASLLSAYTYYKNGNIDLKNGIMVTMTAFIGTIIGSFCQSQLQMEMMLPRGKDLQERKHCLQWF